MNVLRNTHLQKFFTTGVFFKVLVLLEFSGQVFDSNSTKTTEKKIGHLGGDLFTSKYVVKTPVLTDIDQEINMNQETQIQGTMKRFFLMLTPVEPRTTKTVTFHYTGSLIGIPFMVYHNRYRTG